ncbi:MAG: chorismate synthase [Bacteroidota bacterium]|nr:chorismate synthase [Bacteroidota bacterium]
MHTYGNFFQIHTWGSSHAAELGVVIDGVPAGIPMSEADFFEDLLRRKAGAKGTTPRLETDEPEIISGVYQGNTTGAPIHIRFRNAAHDSSVYEERKIPRPGHADFAANVKFGANQDTRGGGFFSGRMTVLLVAAGVVAKKIMPQLEISADITHVGGSANIENALDEAIKHQDSLGARIKCVVNNLPIGIGEPNFNSIESMISHLVFAIPGAKAIAFGSGEAADVMRGSEYNDLIINAEGKTKTNHAGGVNGGISNGNPLIFSVKFKPTSSIVKAQETFNPETNQQEMLSVKGKHDVCYALRAPVIVEAVAAIALVDLLFAHKARIYE